MDELFEKMRDLISNKLDIDKEKITMDSSFRGDLATDSLDTYEPRMLIKNKHNVNVKIYPVKA